MAVNNFDSVAPVYDRLSKLVFGKSLLRAQLSHIKEIADKDRVLIIGGGTGEIIEHIPRLGELDFVEKSEVMLDRARLKQFVGRVNFIHQDFLKFETDKKYNVIICPFFLDCFGRNTLKIVLTSIKQLLVPSGKFIVIDFNEKSSTSLFVKLMHLFFKLTVNLESNRLKDIHSEVLKNQFALVNEKLLHRNRLFSRLYRNL